MCRICKNCPLCCKSRKCQKSQKKQNSPRLLKYKSTVKYVRIIISTFVLMLKSKKKAILRIRFLNLVHCDRSTITIIYSSQFVLIIFFAALFYWLHQILAPERNEKYLIETRAIHKLRRKNNPTNFNIFLFNKFDSYVNCNQLTYWNDLL